MGVGWGRVGTCISPPLTAPPTHLASVLFCSVESSCKVYLGLSHIFPLARAILLPGRRSLRTVGSVGIDWLDGVGVWYAVAHSSQHKHKYVEKNHTNLLENA